MGHRKTTRARAARPLILLAASLLFLFFASQASAAGPFHPREEALDITALNHACGDAVDSQGDIYASSAGEAKIKIFNEAHAEIGQLANSSEPCALAVDSKGNLYVSEAKTGEVLKYHPSAYPFSGAPSYEAPVTIDASGKAKGISVDPTDDSLYVAEGTRVAIYKSNGALFTGNEVQVLTFTGTPTGGTFRLSFEGQSTGWSGQATLGASESGTGDLSVAEGKGDLTALAKGTGTLTEGSKEITGVTTSEGAFKVGESISTFSVSEGLPAGTTIEALGAGALTVSAPASASGSRALTSGSKTIANVNTSSGAFEVGQTIEAQGGGTGALQPGTTIAAVGAGTLTLSRGISAPGTGRALFAASATVKNLSGGPFVAGHAISGAGIPEGTTIEALGAGTLTLSKLPTKAGTGVPLTAGSTAVSAMSTTTGKLANGETISGPGIQAATTVSEVNEGAGTFTLSKPPSASGAKSLTANLGYQATSAAIQAALEKLPAIGAGNVSVSNSEKITFTGALAGANVPQLGADGSGLVGGGAKVETRLDGFDGHLEGGLSGATGVASYTSPGSSGFGQRRYLSVAEPASDQVELFAGAMTTTAGGFPGTLEALSMIDGSGTPAASLGLAPTAYLSADPESGHLFAYDATHKVLDEFEPTGQYLTRIVNPGFADAGPTQVAVRAQRNEIQQVQVSATGGKFKLSFEGQQTAGIKLGAKARTVQLVLEGLSTVGAGNVLVVGGEGAPYRVVFLGALGERNVPQLGADGSELTGTGPSVTASTLRDGAGPGALYVSAGTGAGAKLLAFGPLPAPGRLELGEPPSHAFAGARGTAVDSHGDYYVAGESAIRIYGPSGAEITHIEDPGKPYQLAVGPEGNLYVANEGTGASGDEKVVRYQPSAYPFSGTPTYTEAPTPVETVAEPRGLAVDPANGHLFVTHNANENGVKEYKSAAEGSGLLDPRFCGIGTSFGIGVYGANGDVYIVNGSEITVCSASGAKVLSRIDGTGSPGGAFGGLLSVSLAVDQSNGHLLLGLMKARGVVEEYEASGAFLAQYGSFAAASKGPQPQVAISNSGGPSDGDLYVAYGEKLTVLGALSYGEAPVAVTGAVNEIGGSEATLNGSVDPRGFAVEDCHFEYLEDVEYRQNLEESKPSFEGAEEASCVPSAAELGQGSEPVAVHVRPGGLDPEGRYRYRLVAENRFGVSKGEPGLFGPPAIEARSAQPILYREATLRGAVDPSGLQTEYHFEYLNQAEYEANGESFEGARVTPIRTLPANGGGATAVEASLTGLAEGTTYRFRLVAENEDATVDGLTQELTTQERHPHLGCENETLRLEDNSANLPDCRAYELVTPADTRGGSPGAAIAEGGLDNWLVIPHGPLAGDGLAFSLKATALPGYEGNGGTDSYRATRGPGGWGSSLFSPSSVETGTENAITQLYLSPDLNYSFWRFGADSPPGVLPNDTYLRTPAGFEVLGQGSLGTSRYAQGDLIAPGGAHVIFSTRNTLEDEAVKLEPTAPPTGTEAIYDRTPAGPTRVVSLLPGDVTPSGNATYEGANEAGTAVAFKVGGSLYLRLDDAETLKVADGPAQLAAVAEDGSRILYSTRAGSLEPTDLYTFDVASRTATRIAPDSEFVNVSADGSHVYFTSKDQLDAAEKGIEGEDNLYVWDGSTIRLVALLDPEDLKAFEGEGTTVNLSRWTPVYGPPREGSSGVATDPSRTNPTGTVFVFQSHADLTPPYEADGHSEVYRYDADTASLLCLSCDPTGAPAGSDAVLQGFAFAGLRGSTLIPNVTEGGNEVFFQTAAQLLPEDANAVTDVYEWQAQGTGGCRRESGCLALISSGQSDQPSTIYSMTPDGHDVFFRTQEKLIGSDVAGSPSIYDARVDGGFPAEVVKEPCHGDACQGEGSAPPSRPAVGSDVPGAGNAEAAPASCPQGKRRVKGRCIVKSRHGNRHHGRHRRAKHNRRAAR
jgi:sugar lactone lactonase YvrE